MFETIVKLLYGLATPFIWHPERSYLMALGFGILFAVSIWRSGKSARGTQLGYLFAAFLWVIFGLLDQRYQEFDLRVDTVFTWPPVLAVSVVAAWFAIRSFTARKRAPRNPGLPVNDPSPHATPHQ